MRLLKPRPTFQHQNKYCWRCCVDSVGVDIASLTLSTQLTSHTAGKQIKLTLALTLLYSKNGRYFLKPIEQIVTVYGNSSLVVTHHLIWLVKTHGIITFAWWCYLTLLELPECIIKHNCFNKKLNQILEEKILLWIRIFNQNHWSCLMI